MTGAKLYTKYSLFLHLLMTSSKISGFLSFSKLNIFANFPLLFQKNGLDKVVGSFMYQYRYFFSFYLHFMVLGKNGFKKWLFPKSLYFTIRNFPFRLAFNWFRTHFTRFELFIFISWTQHIS